MKYNPELLLAFLIGLLIGLFVGRDLVPEAITLWKSDFNIMDGGCGTIGVYNVKLSQEEILLWCRDASPRRFERK